jgi:hypothetical protein
MGRKTRAEVGRELGRRLGAQGQYLNALLALEGREHEAGLRDEGEPSRALTEIQRRLSLSEFTPDERARIRLGVGIDVLADIGLGDACTDQDIRAALGGAE